MPPQDVALPPAGEAEYRAVVDIGTNSVKLLLARVHGHRVWPALEKGIQTRLGEGFFSTRRLQAGAIRRTAETVATFVREAREQGAIRCRIVATAAAREAINGNELVDAVFLAAGAPIEIITGDHEADLAFRGATSAPGLSGRAVLVADVGGGSTELAYGRQGTRLAGQSFPVGAVRVWEALAPSDRPGFDELARCRRHLDAGWLATAVPFLRAHGVPAHGQESSLDFVFVGVGGTASVLASIHHRSACFDRELIESTLLTAEIVTELTEMLWNLPLNERRQLPGLPPERADIILTGSAIYESLLRTGRLGSLRPSTRGLRYAALLDS